MASMTEVATHHMDSLLPSNPAPDRVFSHKHRSSHTHRVAFPRQPGQCGEASSRIFLPASPGEQQPPGRAGSAYCLVFGHILPKHDLVFEKGALAHVPSFPDGLLTPPFPLGQSLCIPLTKAVFVQVHFAQFVSMLFF